VEEYEEAIPMDDAEDDPMGQDENEEEGDEMETSSSSKSAPAQKKPASKAKRMRRRGVIYCRHGCGFKFVSPSAQGPGVRKGPVDRKLRDQFDYHEQQQCPMLPRLVCPLECQYRGKVLSFAGPKALRQHYKTKSHQHAVEERKQPFDLTRFVLEADYAPERVHGNPRTHGFRKKAPRDAKPAAVAKTQGRPKRLKALPAPDTTAEFVTVDVDVLMSEPVDVLGMAPPPDTREPRYRQQAAFARSSRSLEKMQRVVALGALASRRLAPDRPAVVVEVVRTASAVKEEQAPTMTARQIKTVFRGLRFA
jgi:hypothetical protein